MTGRTRLQACVMLVVAAALVLSGCGGSSSSAPKAGPTGGASSATHTPATSTPTTRPTGSSSAPSVVDGVRLTPQGTKLKVGDAATVSWQPDQKTVGVIRVTVTELQKVSISAFRDWRLDASTRKSTPYYVHATVKNLGKSDLSRVPVPLYLLDGRNTLLQSSTFRARFTPCPSRPLPAKFTRGHKTTVCLVYFAPDHGKLVAISFRPTQDFDAITWTGHVKTVRQHSR